MQKPNDNQAIKIVLTGGGTAGHVMPHIALLPYLKQQGWTPIYIGSKGIEKNLIARYQLPFFEIRVGKLRRYLSWENVTDIFRLMIGLIQSCYFLFKIKPQIVYSKGGFVSVPVAVAAKMLRIPVVTHESDLTPGLANRIIARFSNVILYSFPETGKYLNKYSAKLVGIPVRQDLLTGDASLGKKLCGFSFDSELPTILVMGGSLGAQRINDALAKALPELVKSYGVIHITGKGKGIATYFSHPNYKSFEFLNEELKDILAAADVVISRSGANSIFEFLRLAKPMILIPLEIGSRGDQVDNARCFHEYGFAAVIREADLSEQKLLSVIEQVFLDRNLFKEKLLANSFPAQPELLIIDSLRKCLTIVEHHLEGPDPGLFRKK